MFSNSQILWHKGASSVLNWTAFVVGWNAVVTVLLIMWCCGTPIALCFVQSVLLTPYFVLASDVLLAINAFVDIWFGWEFENYIFEELKVLTTLSDLWYKVLVGFPVSLTVLLVGARYPQHTLWALFPRFLGGLRQLSLQLNNLAVVTCNHFKTKHHFDMTAVQYVVYFCIYVSALSSLWFSIGSNPVTDSTHSDSWIYSDVVLERASFTSSYVRSLYFILVSLFTIGFGDISPTSNVEIMFTLFLILNGTIFVALLISTITSRLSNRDVAMNRYRHAVSRIFQYVSKRHGNLVQNQEVLRRYMNHLYTQQNCMLLTELFAPKVLPPLIGDSYKELLVADQLRNTAYFKSLDNEEILLACAHRLQFVTYVPGYEIVVQGEKLSQVILVRSGKLDVFATGMDKALCQLLPGDCYGEYETFYGHGAQTCGMIIKSCTGEHTDVAILTAEDLNFAFKLHHARLLSSQQAQMKAVMEAHKRAVEAVRSSHHVFVMKCHKMQSTMSGLLTGKSGGVGGKEKKLAAMMANKVVEKKYSRFIVLPSSTFRLYWDLAMIAGVLFVALSVPITIMQEYATGSLSSQHVPWSAPVVLCYMVYYLLLVPDVVMRAGMFAYERVDTGDFEMKETVRVLVIKHHLIFQRFLGSRRCWLSMFYCLPFEAFGSVFGYMSLWYIPKLLTLLLFPQILQDIQVFLDTKLGHGGRFSISNEMFIVLLLSVSTLVVIVWNAAAWSVMHYGGHAFITSIYFTLTMMTTSGYGDITPSTTMQTLYVCGFCIIGPVISASIIGNIASYVHCVEQSVESIEHRKAVTVCFSDYLHNASVATRSRAHQRAGSGTRPIVTTVTTITSPTVSAAGYVPRKQRSSMSVNSDGGKSTIGYGCSRDNYRTWTGTDASGASCCSDSELGISTEVGADIEIHQPTSSYGLAVVDTNDVDLEENGSACKLLQYYDYVDRTSLGFDGQVLIEEYVPKHIVEFLHQDDVAAVMTKIVMFSNCDPLFLRTLRQYFKYSVYVKGEQILVAEPPGSGHMNRSGRSTGRAGLYYIDSGVVAVNTGILSDSNQLHNLAASAANTDTGTSTKSFASAADDEEVLYYGRGEIFGGESLFPCSIVDASKLKPVSFAGVVTAQTDCVLYFLSTSDFLTARRQTTVPDSVLVKMFAQCHANRRVSAPSRRSSGSFASVLDILRAGNVGTGLGGSAGGVTATRKAGSGCEPVSGAVSRWAMIRSNVPNLAATRATSVQGPKLSLELPLALPLRDKPKPGYEQTQMTTVAYSLVGRVRSLLSTVQGQLASACASLRYAATAGAANNTANEVREDSMENATLCSPATNKAQFDLAAMLGVQMGTINNGFVGDNGDEALEFWYDPVGPVFGLWAVFVLVSVEFLALALPVTMTAAASNDYGDYTSVIFWFQPIMLAYHAVDAVLLADIYFHSRWTGYYEATELVTDRDKIWKRYRASRQFLLHTVASLPIELVVMLALRLMNVHFSGSYPASPESSSCAAAASVDSSGFSALQVYSFCRFLRLLRLSEVQIYSGIIAEFAHSLVVYYGWSESLSTLKVKKNVTTLCALVCVMCYCAHVIGCTFLTIGLQSYYTSSPDGNWLVANELLPPCSNDGADLLLSQQQGQQDDSLSPLVCCLDVSLSAATRVTLYVHSLYWAVGTLCTVGYGDISAVSIHEQQFNVVVFIIGTIVFALVIVNLQDIISQLDVTHDNFKSHVDKVRTLLNRESSHGTGASIGAGDSASNCNNGGAYMGVLAKSHISEEYMGRVDKYFNTLWTISRGVDGQEVKSYLPERVYADLIAVHMDAHLSSLFFFKDVSNSFLYDACAQFVSVVYLPKDYLFHVGEIATSLYVVISGEVNLSREDDGASSPTGDATSSGEVYAVRGVGPLGESEFFNRSYYNYAAVVPTSSRSNTGSARGTRGSVSMASPNGATVVMEMTFTVFWELVKKHSLRRRYTDLMGQNFEESHRRSSSFAVAKLQATLKNNRRSICANADDGTRTDRLIVSPDSAVAAWWSLISLTMLAYVAISVPYVALLPNKAVDSCGDAAADSDRNSASFNPMLLLVVCDALYLCYGVSDIVLRSSYLGVKVDGQKIVRTADIRKLYVGSAGSVLDGAATVPLSLCITTALMVLAENEDCKSAQVIHAWSSISCWIRILFLLRLHRLSELVDFLMLYVGQKLKVTVNTRMIRLCKGIGLVWYACHLFACAFCALGYHELRFSSDSGSWIRSNGLEEAAVTDIYLRSYFVMMYTLSTVGYGSMTIASDSERLFTAAVMLCGSIICDAGVAAIMGSMITSNDQQKNITRMYKESIAKFCHVNDVNKTEIAKSVAYFEYVQNRMRSGVESEAFSYLSPALRVEFARTLALPPLMNLNVLQFLPREVQIGYFHSIVRKLEAIVISPGDKLNPFDMYVLRWGKLQLLQKSQERVMTTDSQTSSCSNASFSTNSRSIGTLVGARLSIFSPGRRTNSDCGSSSATGSMNRGSAVHRGSMLGQDITLVAAGTLICDKERCFLQPPEDVNGEGDVIGDDSLTSRNCGGSIGLLPATDGPRGRRRSSLGRRASVGMTPLEVFHEGNEDSSDSDSDSERETSEGESIIDPSALVKDQGSDSSKSAVDDECSCSEGVGDNENEIAAAENEQLVMAKMSTKLETSFSTEDAVNAVLASVSSVQKSYTVTIASVHVPYATLTELNLVQRNRAHGAGSLYCRCAPVNSMNHTVNDARPFCDEQWRLLYSLGNGSEFSEATACGDSDNETGIMHGLHEFILQEKLSLSFPIACSQVRLLLGFMSDSVSEDLSVLVCERDPCRASTSTGSDDNTIANTHKKGRAVVELGEIVIDLAAAASCFGLLNDGCDGGEKEIGAMDFPLRHADIHANESFSKPTEADWVGLLLHFEATMGKNKTLALAPSMTPVPMLGPVPEAEPVLSVAPVPVQTQPVQLRQYKNTPLRRLDASNRVRSIKHIVGDTIVCISAESVDVTNISAAQVTETDASAAVLDPERTEGTHIETEDPHCNGCRSGVDKDCCCANCSSSLLVGAIERSAKLCSVPCPLGKIVLSVTISPGDSDAASDASSCTQSSVSTSDSSIDSTTDSASTSCWNTEECCTNTMSAAAPSLLSASERGNNDRGVAGNFAGLPTLGPQQEYLAHEYCHLLHISALDLKQIATYYRDVNKPISSKLD